MTTSNSNVTIEDGDTADTIHENKVDDDEADPLEAFMTELDANEEIVPQESINAISTMGLQGLPSQVQVSNTISMEDIMSLSREYKTTDDREGEGWESDVASDVGAEEEDEETLERDRIEFMKAMKSLHQAPKDDELEATIAAVVQKEKQAEESVQVQTTEVKLDSEIKVGVKKSKELGRIFADGGDVMEEHEREVN